MRHVILNFHGIGTDPREREPGEARYWLSPDEFGLCLERVIAHAGEVRCTLTFDDGNASDLTIGAEMLARHGLTARVFPLTDRIGTPGNLSADDIRALQAMGHHIGSHGAAHVDWTGLDDAGQIREFDEARAILAEILGAPVTEAAIPFGRYDRRSLSALRRRGYARIYSSDGGPVRSGRLPLPRTSLRAGVTAEEIDALLTGREPAGRRLRRGLGRLRKRLV
jgi:peptidoglycan/xylan/chitin deacetylase (PgdA/CDA1 family)